MHEQVHAQKRRTEVPRQSACGWEAERKPTFLWADWYMYMKLGQTAKRSPCHNKLLISLFGQMVMSATVCV